MADLGILSDIQNAQLNIGELRDLNKALRANAAGDFQKGSVGYPQQGVGYTGDLAPLVPQSIQGTLDSATFTLDHIVFWKLLAKNDVTSTLHESNRVNQHGMMDLDPFIAEGGVGPLSEAEYKRRVVQIKYLAEHIELTDVATMVGITGPNRSALAQRTLNGTAAILGKLERALFSADSDLSPLHFDGLYKQIRAGAPNNYKDKRGAPTSPQELMERLAMTGASPNFGFPTHVLVEPAVFSALSQIATSYGRHTEMASANGAQVVSFGNSEIYINGPTGRVRVLPVPLMAPPRQPNTQALGAKAPTLNLGMLTPSVVAGSNPLFVAGDAGDYWYILVAVGDKGVSAPVTLGAAATIGAGGKFRLDVDDSGAPTSGDNSIRFYRLFRSPKNAASASAASWCGYFPRNTSGVGGGTRIEDTNAVIPNTSRVFSLQLTPDVMRWNKLLDFTRRPLAQVQTTVPFLLLLFGALDVMVPEKNDIMDNVSLTL